MSIHNKKRNTGLLYEFLVKTISQALVENDKKKSSKALKIIKSHFKPGTELYKEFRLIHSIMKTTVSSEAVAASILNEAKSAARSHNSTELDREKSLLIRSINHQLNDENFYDQHISEYRTFATLQSLLNDWRLKTPDLSRMAGYEDQIVRWLVTPKSQENNEQIVNEEATGSNRLLMKIMMKKLGEKYDNTLTTEQKSLIKAYAFSAANGDENKTIIMKLKEIREKLLGSIEQYVNNSSEGYLTGKLVEVKNQLINEISSVDDGTVAEYMLYIKLIDELSGGENV